MNELNASKRFAHFPEADMTKVPTTLTRRRIFRAGAALAAATATPMLIYARFYQDSVANICGWLDSQATEAVGV